MEDSKMVIGVVRLKLCGNVKNHPDRKQMMNLHAPMGITVEKAVDKINQFKKAFDNVAIMWQVGYLN